MGMRVGLVWWMGGWVNQIGPWKPVLVPSTHITAHHISIWTRALQKIITTVPYEKSSIIKYKRNEKRKLSDYFLHSSPCLLPQGAQNNCMKKM